MSKDRTAGQHVEVLLASEIPTPSETFVSLLRSRASMPAVQPTNARKQSPSTES